MRCVGETNGEAWLYVRSDRAIRIRRSSDGLMVLVCGPGPNEHAHVFNNRAFLEKFLTLYTEFLERDGWLLQPVAERRQETGTGPRPAAVDRRRCNPAGLW